MKLPNANLAIIEEAKVIDYLLNQKHRFGASKARFFAQFGFRPERWEDLAAALREHGRQNEVTKVRETGFGPRYEVEGELTTPDGRRSRVRRSGSWTTARLHRVSSPRILWSKYD